jgi:hypothetical protein
MTKSKKINLTKEFFKNIAKILNENYSYCDGDSNNEIKPFWAFCDDLLQDFCEYFKKLNLKFDEDKFKSEVMRKT